MTQQGRRPSGVSPDETRRIFRRLEGILTSPQYQRAVEGLQNNPTLQEEAQANPRTFLTDRGVEIDDDATVELVEGNSFYFIVCYYWVCGGFHLSPSFAVHWGS